MHISDDIVMLEPLDRSQAGEFSRLYSENEEFLAPFSPIFVPEVFSDEGQDFLLSRSEQLWREDRDYGFAIRLGDTGPLVGRITLSNVVRGAWESCTLGYWVSKAYNRKGLATRAVRLVAKAAFCQFRLHRIQAAIMPRNSASLRVIHKAGFVYEGYAPKYLRINGQWEDHKIYSLTREIWDKREGESKNMDRTFDV